MTNARSFEAAYEENERRTKRFFEVTDARKGTTRKSGCVYEGDFVEHDGNDWIADGEGTFRGETGDVLYQGDWSGGLRHGHGRTHFQSGDSWSGNFDRDWASGLGTYIYASDSDEESDNKKQPREALFHHEKLCAFVDQLILGKRLRVYDWHRASPFGYSGTIVGIVNKDKACFYIHFDHTGRREIIDLRQQRFEILEHENSFYRIESTAINDLDSRYDPKKDTVDKRRISYYNENIFRPEQAMSTKEKVNALGDGARTKSQENFAIAQAAKADAILKSRLDEEISNQRQLKSRGAQEAADFELTIKQKIKEKRIQRESKLIYI